MRACEATAGPWSVAAVSERQESKLFAPLDATVSLRTCPRGQTSSGQDWKGAGIVGRWLGTLSLVRAVGAWMLIAILGRRPAARVVRSSPAFCHDHWLGRFGQLPVVHGRSSVAARAEIRPGFRTSPFRSHWRDEVATTGLPADERAQARSLIED